METTESSNIDHLIGHLKKINENNLIDIFIPSLNQNAKFKQLTVKQQSSLITGVIAQEADKNAFSYNRSTNVIIKENNINAIPLRVVDRGAVLAQLRSDTLGGVLTLEDIDWDISEIDYTLDDESVKYITETHVYELSGMKVEYTTPTLESDVSLNADAEEKWVEDTGVDIISDLFKLELAKFITTINVESTVDIIMADLNTNDKIKVCDALPVKITRHVMKYIQDVKTIEQELLRLDDTTFIPTDITLFST